MPSVQGPPPIYLRDPARNCEMVTSAWYYKGRLRGCRGSSGSIHQLVRCCVMILFTQSCECTTLDTAAGYSHSATTNYYPNRRAFSSVPRKIAPTCIHSATVRLCNFARCTRTRRKTIWRLALASRTRSRYVLPGRKRLYSVISSSPPFPAGRFACSGEYISGLSQGRSGQASLSAGRQTHPAAPWPWQRCGANCDSWLSS